MRQRQAALARRKEWPKPIKTLPLVVASIALQQVKLNNGALTAKFNACLLSKPADFLPIGLLQYSTLFKKLAAVLSSNNVCFVPLNSIVPLKTLLPKIELTFALSRKTSAAGLVVKIEGKRGGKGVGKLDKRQKCCYNTA